MRTPWEPGVSIPTDNGAEIEALAGSNPSFAAWEQNEPYTIALLIKGKRCLSGTLRLTVRPLLRPGKRRPGGRPQCRLTSIG
jgi:hypothetical protein